MGAAEGGKVAAKIRIANPCDNRDLQVASLHVPLRFEKAGYGGVPGGPHVLRAFRGVKKLLPQAINRRTRSGRGRSDMLRLRRRACEDVVAGTATAPVRPTDEGGGVGFCFRVCVVWVPFSFGPCSCCEATVPGPKEKSRRNPYGTNAETKTGRAEKNYTTV